MTAARFDFDTFAVSAIAAVNSFGEIVTGTLVSVAPAVGMLPSAYVTWRHMVDALGIDPWVAGGLAFGVDALGIGLASRRASLDRINLTQHMRKLTGALYAYFFIVALGNIFVSVQFSKSISAGVFESALALLPLPVALLMAVNSEADAVAADANNARAVELAQMVSDKAEAAQIRAEGIAERAAMRAEKRNNFQSKPAQVAQVPEPAPQVADKQPRKHIDLAKLAQALQDKPDSTNDELGKIFDVSGEAVRLARKKLPSAPESATK